MTFTNRQSDATGFGVLEITNADPLHFAATTHYTQLTLGDFSDYFDVNNAAAVKVTSDGKYAFVAGYNGGPFGYGAESVDGVQAGSNIGIISDPLGPNPQLVAATRPIPLGFTTDLTLSNDGKYLYASYPNGGGVYVFNVDQIINTLNHPDSYVIDELDRGVGSRFFDASQQRSATFADLNSVPIDDINPNISVAADYGIILEDRARNQFTYGVLQQSDGQGGLLDSNHGPIATGGSPRGLATAPSDWLHLTSPTQTQSNLDPTFSWNFDPGNDVTEVDLFVSTFDQGHGLLPWDKVVDLSNPEFLPNESEQQKEQLLTKSWHGYEDFNPGRILTATWKKDTNTWYLNDGTTIVAQSVNGNTTFTLPDLRRLTAGQTYHWAVEAFNSNGKSNIDFGQFKTISPVSTNPFSSVTVLTHGFTLLPNNTGVPDDFFKLADNIVSASSADNNDKGLILLYNKPTGLWVPVNSKGQELTDVTGGLNPGDTNYLSTLAHNIETNYVHQNKALVLLPEWSTGGESTQSESGFTEAAADAIFASIVGLDQALGGDVGEHDASGNLVKLYDDKGDLIRTQGDIFNSPLHFIGFSRGTVVESEIIQRLGKFYPYAGGAINADGTPVLKDGKPVRDLQMTTIDPHDFAQESLKVDIPGTNLRLKDFTDFHDPKVEVWSNVTFADNYYQTVADPNGSTWTPNGRAIDGADVNVNLDGRTGFTWDDRKGGPHGNVLSWYAGTVDLGLDKVGNGYTQQARPIYNELGEKGVQDLLNPKDNPVSLTPWYSTASSEGIDNGWFYSVLGGGEDLRPTVDLSQRVSVDFDNTDDAVAKGDFAIPTVFNGNFDVGSSDDPNAPVPGWSFHNGDGNQPLLMKDLVDVSTIPTLVEPQPTDGTSIDENGQSILAPLTAALYAPTVDQRKDLVLQLGGKNQFGQNNPTEVVHGLTKIPDWGVLRFDVHAPNLSGDNDPNSSIRVWIEDDNKVYEELKSQDPNQSYDFSSLQQNISNLNLDRPAVDLREIPQKDKNALAIQRLTNRVGFGQRGFETFFVDIPQNLRGKARHIKFEFQPKDNSQVVYIDNISVQSLPLEFGVPKLNGQEARDDNNNFADNYLSEKPQYTMSYNATEKTPNWVTWELNNEWVSGKGKRLDSGFAEDISLPFQGQRVTNADYKINPVSERIYDMAHITPNADRTRDQKDASLTFLTSNTLAQNTDDYDPARSPWNKLETALQGLAKKPVTDGSTTYYKDIYVTAGGIRSASDIDKLPNTNQGINNYNNFIPTHFWKLVLVLKEPNVSLYEINQDPQKYISDAFAIIFPNFQIKGEQVDYTVPGSGRIINVDQSTKGTNTWNKWQTWTVGLDELESATNLEFLTSLSPDAKALIQNKMALRVNNKNKPIDSPPKSSLLADNSMTDDLALSGVSIVGTFSNLTIRKEGFQEQSTSTTRENHSGLFPGDAEYLGSSKISIGQDSPIQINSSELNITQSSTVQNSPRKISIGQVSAIQGGASQTSTSQVSAGQVGIRQNSSAQIDTSQIGETQIGTHQLRGSKFNSLNISTNQVSPFQVGINQTNTRQASFSQTSSSQISSPQVGVTQISSNQVSSFQVDSNKISLPSSIPSQQLFGIHTLTPELITTINNTAQTLWNTLLTPQTPFNINLQLTDSLAKGQLAEAIVTKYDAQGRPIGGTIEVDPTANGLGWFIDPNITDSNEFSQTLSSTASRATTNSDAYGHYDLLTALLHEMAHLAGFIWGNSGFDSHVQIVNSSRLFVGDNFSAPLTNDGSHLDPKTYAYDLLNPTLTPGLRELPSQIDVEILKEVRSTNNVGENTSTQAALDSAPLTEILNGKFDILDTTDPNYGWTTRGAATVLSKEAVLTEDSPLNSEFKQTFTVPQGAKYLEFTLKDATLGNDSALAPGDAFEVALLDANEKTSLVDTANGLTRTDALLNIQHDGKAYLSNQVILPATVSPNSTLSLHSPMTFKVDVSNIQVGTTATLYFDLLGFGNRDAKVTIDDVELLNSDPVPPVANNDTATTDAGKQVTINVLANDTSNQTIDPTRIAIATNPTNGNIAVNKDGTLAYTPNNNFVGTDTFTYTVANSDGTTSSPATVTVTVKDVAPTITDIPVPKKVYQLDPTNFSATATTTGDNHLTYTWDFGDGTNPTQGATVQHTFTTSGEYQITLQVVDAIGLKDTKTVTVYVGSTAPGSGDDPTLPPGFGDVAPQITDLPVPKKVYELDPTNFSATATSPLGEPLTYTWNFGDGTDAVVGQSVSHTFVASGQYDATLTVTDDFGFSDTKTVTVYVGSTAPTNDGSSLPDWNGTWDDIFRQFGNMS